MLKMATQVGILRAGSSFAVTLARLKNVTKAFFNGLLVRKCGQDWMASAKFGVDRSRTANG